jgi:hypothetical protein
MRSKQCVQTSLFSHWKWLYTKKYGRKCEIFSMVHFPFEVKCRSRRMKFHSTAWKVFLGGLKRPLGVLPLSEYELCKVSFWNFIPEISHRKRHLCLNLETRTVTQNLHHEHEEIDLRAFCFQMCSSKNSNTVRAIWGPAPLLEPGLIVSSLVTQEKGNSVILQNVKLDLKTDRASSKHSPNIVVLESAHRTITRWGRKGL